MSVNEIVKGLWIGNMDAATDYNFFKKHNISAVVNCTPDVPAAFAKYGVNYLRVNLNDSLKQQDIEKMINYLPKAISFIYQKREIEGKNVLVHCHAGMQRSAAITAAYISKIYGISINDAINLILKKRPVAFHNGTCVNFSQALLHFK